MTALLKDIFEKQIDRPIDGVIKADDEAKLRVELDEYVITNEIGQRVGEFLDAYNNYETSNGVWISGFFGSGKSHLLKMLALVLERREVDGTRADAIFEAKDKIADEPFLAGGLRKAVSIPSKSILFNIDQKADVISKTDVDALLAVFQKVFDESCGYYGKLPHIAQFERDLDRTGQLTAFRDAYANIAGEPWEAGREIAKLRSDRIGEAYAEVTNGDPTDAKGLLDRYRQDTKISIEDFADTVKAWIDQQPKGFRLNFFVDEVGQYIADNVKLMTNLQTIAESLNTKCKGQAWIIVTAQQDMASVIGDMTKQQENDFSKIQARFRNRMPLNSADVAEVIQKRLLAKTDEGEVRLGTLYDREENNFKTLFDFADGSFNFKNFRDRGHFVASYPFASYQYDLFQMSIEELSRHNAFEGKHSSVGERSMLGVFQEVATKMKDQPVGGLVTFDLMFEGIRTALKSSVQQSIQVAERNIDDLFAVRVLKALFLVKYVKAFKSSVRNISILLLPDFEVDQAQLRRKVEEALGLLDRNTLIQRNGEFYEFLTNEEKDIESEIRSLEIDHSEVNKEIETLAFDTILRQRRLKHLATGHEYPFTRCLDDHSVGREWELFINMITPFSEDTESPETIRMRNMSREELAVLMPADANFVREIGLYKKTEKFIRQARTGNPQPERERIVAEKGEQNRRRLKDLELRLRKLIGEARLFVRGDELDIGGDDPQDRISKAFQALVDKVYTNLGMLRGVSYTEADIMKSVQPDGGLFGGSGGALGEAEQEVLSFVNQQDRNGVKVSVKNLTERFAAKPYGWPVTAVLCLAGSLVAKDKVEARVDSVVTEGADLAKSLNNSHALPNILLTPQTEFTQAQIRKAKEVYQELFSKPAAGNDARSLGAEWAASVEDLAREVDLLTRQENDYPFVSALVPLRDRLQILSGKPAAWYITEPAKAEDELLDAKEEILDKIKSFMAGGQKTIYDHARKTLSLQSANIDYIDREKGEALRAALDDPNCFRGSAIQNLKDDVYTLREKVDLRLADERKTARAALDSVQAKLTATPEFNSLRPEHQDQVTARIAQNRSAVDTIDLIAVLRDRTNGFEIRLLPELLAEVARLQPSPEPPQPPKPGDDIPPQKPKPAESNYVSARDVKVDWPEPYLSDAADVERYVDAMKRNLLTEIAAGKKVIV